MKNYHLEKLDVHALRDVWPYIIYQHIALTSPRAPLFFPIDPGYWFLLRHIRAKWAEVDAAGAAFANEILVEVVESSLNRIHQNAPVPFRLITTPGSNGVQVNGAGLMTATGPRIPKMINEVRPHRDNITLYISGQNAVPFPAFINVAIVGYMIPDNRFDQWKGTNDE